MATELDLSSHDTPSLEKNQLSEIKDVKPSQVGNAAGLGPMTPIADRGNREALVGSDTPITWVSSPLTVVACKSSRSENTDSDSVHRTPKRRVFDPFAPGPDELMFAPRKKPLEESRSRTMRRLNFQSCGDFMEDVGENDLEDGIHEEKFLESVYESYLDAIVSKQAEGILAENPELELELCNGFKTPTTSPLLKGIAETCPRAPIKPAAKLRSLVSVGICRKLDF